MLVSMRDHYVVLGVALDATIETIRAAHRDRARVCHPDVGGDQAAMILVNEAWRILGDPAARAAYDATRARFGFAAPALRPAPDRTVLDFGRYAGWAIQDIASIDDDYLDWLARTPAGLPFRCEIRRVLDERRRALDALRPSSAPRRTWA